jgi:ribosomal protein S18 acetylase RimI-like enzyme
VVRQARQWQLVQIQLMPSLQGQDVGTMLLQSLIAEARGAGASLRLSVLKANPAKRLYEPLGFAVISQSESAYEMALEA